MILLLILINMNLNVFLSFREVLCNEEPARDLLRDSIGGRQDRQDRRRRHPRPGTEVHPPLQPGACTSEKNGRRLGKSPKKSEFMVF